MWVVIQRREERFIWDFRLFQPIAKVYGPFIIQSKVDKVSVDSNMDRTFD